MNIKILKSFVPNNSDRTRKEGDIMDVTPKYGRQLIDEGFAEEIKQPEVKPFTIREKKIAVNEIGITAPRRKRTANIEKATEINNNKTE